MSLSRWERMTRWALKKTKSKPAQFAISIAAGGSFAAGFHWAGNVILNILPAGGFATCMEVLLYALTTLTFVSTTVLTSRGLAVSFHHTDLLSQTVINLRKKMLKMTNILAQRKELLDHLVNAEKTQSKNFREHMIALQQLLGVADVLTKNLTDPKQRAYCEKLLAPIAVSPIPNVLTQSEPYIEDELCIDIRDEEEIINEWEASSVQTELQPLRNPTSLYQYGSFFTPPNSPTSDHSDDLDAELECAMAKLSLNVASPMSSQK